MAAINRFVRRHRRALAFALAFLGVLIGLSALRTRPQTRPLVAFYEDWAASGDARAPRYHRISGSGSVEDIRDRALAAPVIEAKGGVSQTLSVDVADGHFLAVSKRDGDLGDFVFTWTAPSPVGPWTPHRGIAAPFEDSSGILRYAPLAHPEIALASGRLLVSISRNTSDFERLLTDPTSGRPVFAEIPWPDRAAATADTAPSGPAGTR